MKPHTKINQIRAKILKKLQKGDKLIMNLYWDIGTTWHNCYYHLTVLQELGLVKAEKQKGTTIYGLTDDGHKVLQYYE